MGDSRRSKKRKRNDKKEEPKVKVGGLYHCNYCSRSICTIRIKCAVCPDFDLCLECFSVGVELNDHKNDHSYSIVDRLDFPVFRADWSAQEELLLLEGIESVGLGNWVDIADYIQTKDADQCEEHYFSVHIDTPSFPLPSMERIITTPFKAKPRQKVDKLKKHPAPGPSQPTTTDSGLMSKRQEFEVEYDPLAENYLADMTWNPEADDPALRETKLRLLHIYNQRVSERLRLRQVAIDYHLYDLKKLDNEEKKRKKEERLINNQYKCFSQCWSRHEQVRFLHGLLLEDRLREKYDRLRERKAILTSLCSNPTGTVKLPDIPVAVPEAKAKTEERGKKKRKKDDDSTDTSKEPPPPPPKVDYKMLPLNIATAPDIELLSHEERRLCQTLRLFPSQYLIVKDALIRESIRTAGNVKKHKVRNLINVDNSKISKIVDFCERCGIANNPKITLFHQSLISSEQRGGCLMIPKTYSKSSASAKPSTKKSSSTSSSLASGSLSKGSATGPTPMDYVRTASATSIPLAPVGTGATMSATVSGHGSGKMVKTESGSSHHGGTVRAGGSYRMSGAPASVGTGGSSSPGVRPGTTSAVPASLSGVVRPVRPKTPL
eukprot:CAMPEP_0119158416 /NCGR_PEP_ID=MMETSP1310-20130426/53251_1 /TAXON_ID=464262 /ORGANISM="Genus nov. species nov., Strain RCC2339" /LENGTH=604 /DNA_ID=CAMNT_0007151041 /DNA_START=124 /DNA_END=1935 /DNA_ORIENTATION=-